MNCQQKISFGSVLGVFGGLGIFLSVILEWTQIGSPWSFLLGFLFGLMSGLGATLAVSGLIDCRGQKR